MDTSKNLHSNIFKLIPAITNAACAPENNLHSNIFKLILVQVIAVVQGVIFTF